MSCTSLTSLLTYPANLPISITMYAFPTDSILTALVPIIFRQAISSSSAQHSTNNLTFLFRLPTTRSTLLLQESTYNSWRCHPWVIVSVKQVTTVANQAYHQGRRETYPSTSSSLPFFPPLGLDLHISMRQLQDHVILEHILLFQFPGSIIFAVLFKPLLCLPVLDNLKASNLSMLSMMHFLSALP